MKDDRLRVPVDDRYVEALGRAAYIFATLEWNAVWCCERMQAGYVQTLGRKTAGMIADDLDRLMSALSSARSQTGFSRPAQEFKRLVQIRNGIMHGKPGTAPTGEQRLFRDGAQWTPEMIDDVADAFAACSSLLNALLHGQLK